MFPTTIAFVSMLASTSPVNATFSAPEWTCTVRSLEQGSGAVKVCEVTRTGRTITVSRKAGK